MYTEEEVTSHNSNLPVHKEDVALAEAHKPENSIRRNVQYAIDNNVNIEDFAEALGALPNYPLEHKQLALDIFSELQPQAPAQTKVTDEIVANKQTKVAEVQNKKIDVAQKAETKRAKIDPQNYIQKEQDVLEQEYMESVTPDAYYLDIEGRSKLTQEERYARVQAHRQQEVDRRTAELNYDTWDFIKDSGLSVAKGTVQLVTVAPAIGNLVTGGKVGLDTMQKLTDVTAYLDSLKSKKAQYDSQEVFNDYEAEYIKNKAEAIRKGNDDEFIQQVGSFLEEAGVTLESAWKNPTIIADVLFEQIPSLAIGGLAGKKAVEAVVKNQLTKQGIKHSDKAIANFMKSDVGKKLSKKVATTAGVTTSMLEEGSNIAAESAAHIMRMSIDELKTHSPLFNEIKAANPDMSNTEVKREVASSIAMQAMVVGGAITGIVSKFTGAGRLEGSLFLSRGNNGLIKATTQVAKKAAIEGGEEFLQGTSSQAAANKIIQEQGDDRKGVREGLGIEAALGTLAGAGLGGSAGLAQEIATVSKEKALEKVKETLANNVSEDTQENFEVREAVKEGNESKQKEILDTSAEDYSPRKALKLLTNRIKTKEDLASEELIEEMTLHATKYQERLENILENPEEHSAEDVELADKELEQLAMYQGSLIGLTQLQTNDISAEIAKVKEQAFPDTKDARGVVERTLGSIDNFTPKDIDNLEALANSELVTAKERKVIQDKVDTLKTIKDVNSDVLIGGADPKFRGLAQYQSAIKTLVKKNEPELAQKQLAKLTQFAELHSKKYKELSEAYTVYKKEEKTPADLKLIDSVAKKYGKDENTPFDFSMGKGTSQLINMIGTEAKVLKKGVTESTNVIAGVEQSTTVNEPKPKAAKSPKTKPSSKPYVSNSTVMVDHSSGNQVQVKFKNGVAESIKFGAIEVPTEFKGTKLEAVSGQEGVVKYIDAFLNNEPEEEEELDFNISHNSNIDAAEVKAQLNKLTDEQLAEFIESDSATNEDELSRESGYAYAILSDREDVEGTETSEPPATEVKGADPKKIDRAIKSLLKNIPSEVSSVVSQAFRATAQQELDLTNQDPYKGLQPYAVKFNEGFDLAKTANLKPEEVEALDAFTKSGYQAYFDSSNDTSIFSRLGFNLRSDNKGKNFKNLFKDIAKKSEALIHKIPNVITAALYGKDVNIEDTPAAKHTLEYVEKLNTNLDAIFDSKTKSNKFFEESLANLLFTESDEFLDENIKTAISTATLSYLAEQAGGTLANDFDDIRDILGLSRGAMVPRDAYNKLKYAGTLRVNIVETLGKRAYKALGIELDPKADDGLTKNKLIMDLGQLAVGNALSLGLVEQVSINNNLMTTWRGESISNPDEKRTTSFIAISNEFVEKTNEDTGSKYQVRLINEKLREDLKALDVDLMEKLIGDQIERKDVIYTNPNKMPKTSKKVKGSIQEVPDAEYDIMETHRQRPVQLKKPMYKLISKLGKEAVYKLAGLNTDLDNVQANRLESVTGENLEVTYSIDSLFNFLDKMDKKKDIFFRHEKWKDGRIGMVTMAGINLQADKNHRHLFGYKDQKIKIDLENPSHIEYFKLAVAQGLDIDVDKQDFDTSLAELDAKIAEPVFQEALLEINKLLVDMPYDEDKLIAGVKAGGMKMHTLDALVNYKRYELAKKANRPFYTDLFLETDGITNGVILSLMQFGATANMSKGQIEHIKKLLSQGGVFSDNSFESYAAFKNIQKQIQQDVADGKLVPDETLGLDAYESMARLWKKFLDGYSGASKQFSRKAEAVTAIIGEISRKLAKSPVMVGSYGANIINIINSFSENTIQDGIYSKLENLHKDKLAGKDISDELDIFVNNLTELLNESVDITEDTLLQFTLTGKQERTFMQAVQDTYGKALEDALTAQYGDFFAQRDNFNSIMQSIFVGFKHLLDKALVEATEAKRKRLDNPKAELNEEEYTDILESKRNAMPIINSFFGKNVNNGILIMKEDNTRLYNNPDALVSTNLNQEFNSTLIDQDGSISEEVQSSMNSYLSVKSWKDGGISGAVLGIHFTDAAIMAKFLEFNPALNIHDATGTSIHDTQYSGQELNRAMIEVITNYSLFKEANTSLKRMISELKKAGELENVSAKSTGFKSWDAFAKQLDSDVKKIEANRQKLISDITYWSQYNLEGSGVKVEPKEETSEPTVKDVVEETKTELDQVIDRYKSKTAPFDVTSLGLKDTDGLREILIKLRGTTADYSVLVDLILRSGKEPKIVYNKTPEDVPEQDAFAGLSDRLGYYDHNTKTVYLNTYLAGWDSPEVALHEILHGVIWGKLGNPPAQAKALFNKAKKRITKKVIASIKDPQLKSDIEYALGNIQEFYVVGATNPAVREFLDTFKVNNKDTLGSRFKDILSRLLGFTRKSLATELFVQLDYLAGSKQRKRLGSSANSGIDLNNFKPDFTDTIDATNSMDMFRMLGSSIVGGAKDSPEHSKHLSEIMGDIVNKVISPVSLRIRESSGATAGVYEQATNSVFLNVVKKKPYLTNGIEMSAQEAYVHELIHSVLTAGIDDSTKWASQEIRKMYEKLRNELKPEHFLEAGVTWDKANNKQKAKAQAIFDKQYDYIFKNQDGVGMHEFVAYGLTNESFKRALSRLEGKVKEELSGNFVHKMLQILHQAISFVFDKLHHVNNLPADVKLHKLALELVDTDKSHKGFISKSLETVGEINSKAVNAVVDNILSPLKEKALDLAVNPTAYPRARREIGNRGFEEHTEAVDGVLEDLGLASKDMSRSLLNELKGRTPNTTYLHRLFRKSKKMIDKARADIKHYTISYLKESFADKLDKDQREALNKGLLKTDLSSLLTLSEIDPALNNYSYADIQELLDKPSVLNARINQAKNALRILFPTNGHYYANMASNLGYYMATGSSTEDHLILNTAIIANLQGTPLNVEGNVDKAKALIEELATLASIKHTDETFIKELNGLWAKEFDANPNENGITVSLAMHNRYKQKALNTTLQGQEELLHKGYTKEILNPKKNFMVASEEHQEELEQLGYVKGNRVEKDTNDPSGIPLYYYYSDDHLVLPHQSGIFSFTNNTSKGTNLVTNHENSALNSIDTYVKGMVDVAKVTKSKESVIQAIANNDANRKRGSNLNVLVPVYGSNGAIADYRYVMNEHTKDTFLDKNNNFMEVLGSMEATLVDKVNTKEINSETVKALFTDYSVNGFKNNKDFIAVGLGSDIPNHLEEKYMLLPEETREEIRAVWGSDRMYIREEALPLIFGQRKIGVANLRYMDVPDTFGLDMFKAQLNNLLTFLLNRHGVRIAEDVWREVVTIVKDRIVIASGVVLLGNIISNFVLLKMLGVPVKNLFTDQLEALKAIKQHHLDTQQLARIDNELELKPSLKNNKSLMAQKADLENAIKLNPVDQLIDEGVYQSIIEDVDFTDDAYTSNSRIENFIKPVTEKMNPKVLEVLKEVTVQKDSEGYAFLREATQLSDFVARYALHKHNLSKGMNPEESVDFIMDTFINYDLPTHPFLQYTNDMGITMFTKYFIRVQKVLAKAFYNNPADSLGVMAMEVSLDAGAGIDVADPVEAQALLTDYAHRVNFNPLEIASKTLVLPGNNDWGLISPL